MKRRSVLKTALAATLGTLITRPLLAGAQNNVLLELFTSQGCSSCPAADVLFEKYAHQNNVVALSYHVDYWDYLGWKDTFSAAHFTNRQRQYSVAFKKNTMFTPQTVVGGAFSLVGNEEQKIDSAIGRIQSNESKLDIQTRSVGSRVEAYLNPINMYFSKSEVFLASFIPSAKVKIEAGENAGKELTYFNVVTGFQKIGDWDGQSKQLFAGKIAKGERAAIIVQTAGNGVVVGAVYAS